jgi:PST family polysaccharide transporter
MLSYATNKALTLATTLILARLLVPSDFGLLALASLAIGAIGLVNDLGMWGVLIVRQDFARRAQGTVLTIMLVSRTVLTLLVIGFAQVADDIFREPRLDGILSVLAVTIFIGSVTWFYDAILHRELEFGRRFASQFADSVAYAAVTLTLAALGAGVWSLVAGQIAGLLMHTLLVVALAPYRVRPSFDRQVAREATSQGRGFVVQGGVSFLSQNADTLAVGRVLGAGPLGIYSMGYRLGQLPAQAFADPAVQVSFPVHARMRHRGEDVAPSFLSILRLVALVACPLGVVLSAAAEPFTRTFFDDNWLPLIGLLSVLGIWGAVRPVQTTLGWLLNGVGEANLMGTIAAGFLVLLVPAVFLAAHLSGLEAVAWVMLANLSCSLCVLAWLAARKAAVPLAQQWRAVRPVVLALPACWVAARLVSGALDDAPPALALALAAGAGASAYAVVGSLVERDLLPGAARQAKRVFGRSRVEADAAIAPPLDPDPQPAAPRVP